MCHLQSLFLYFAAIFWVTSMQSYSKYSPFDSSKLFGKGSLKNWKRFLFSILFINLWPIFYTYIVYACLPSSDINFSNFFGVIMLNFVHFGTTRIYHGIVFSKNTRNCFYSEDNIKNVKKKLNTENFESFWANVVPGILYWVICLALGCYFVK